MDENTASNKNDEQNIGSKKMTEHQEREVEVATGAFIIHSGKIFLATGSKFHDKWTVPGGHVDYRETSKDCIEREVKEEISVDVKAIELFSVQEAVHHTVKGRDRHFIFLNWKCEIVSGEPKVDGNEFTKMIWMNINEAMKDPNVMPTVREGLKKLVKG